MSVFPDEPLRCKPVLDIADMSWKKVVASMRDNNKPHVPAP
jgi:hypothetical protein